MGTYHLQDNLLFELYIQVLFQFYIQTLPNSNDTYLYLQ